MTEGMSVSVRYQVINTQNFSVTKHLTSYKGPYILHFQRKC